MSDNLFDRLFELLQSPGPINWKLAAEVAGSLAGPSEPIEPALLEEYTELSLAAYLRINDATGLAVTSGEELQPTDRAGWVNENLRSFAYLVEPFAEGLGATAVAAAGPMGAILPQLGPVILGMQAGTMVGFMGHRTLGQFDTGIPAAGTHPMLLVVPNVEAFAVDHGLDARTVRLWSAAQELVHRAEMAVPWVTDHLDYLMAAYFKDLDFDAERLTQKMQSLEDPEELQRLLGEPGGMAGLIAGEHQAANLSDVQAFVAFLEGYTEWLVEEALRPLIPDYERLSEAVARRRAEPTQGEQFLQQFIGLELKRHLSRTAAGFCREATDRWGREALERIWEDPEHLPSLAELEDPLGWAARVLLD
jgi:putative hydrolase